MAFRDHFEHVPLLLRTIRGTFDVTGRARRTELGWWYLALLVVGALNDAVAGRLLSPWGSFVERQVVARLFVIPLFALFARRLHDQDRSGWWVLLLAALVALHFYDVTTNMAVDHKYVAPQGALPAPLAWLGILIGLAIFALLVAPETIGPNRYGPDPREET